MKTLRPLGVTLTPKPGRPASQYTVSLDGTGKSSMTDLVSRKRGIAAPVLLPHLKIGSRKRAKVEHADHLRPH
jgi:hypothetical protein